MSDMLSIGASGVRAYQTALTTVSENIANAGNASYARRVANMREVTSLGGKSATMTGLGVAVDGVVRTGNPYTEATVRSAAADLSKTEASTVWLDRIETALTGANLSGQVTAFFAAGTALAAEPTSTALRASMLSAGASASDAFSVTARTLDDAAVELDSRGAQAAGELTRLNQALLKANQGLGRTQSGTAAAAQLADERDSILEQMSALTDVAVSLDAIGRATVRGGGAAGAVMVDAREAAQVGYARAGANVVLTTFRSDGESVLTPNGGVLSGMAEGAQRLSAAREQLSTVARDFTGAVNELQDKGDDLNGAKGQPFFAVDAKDPTRFTVALASGAGIAAAARGAGQRDSSNLTKLAGLRTSAGYEGRVQSLVTDNAATLKQRKLVAQAQTAIHDGAITARSEVSGVNLDSEAVDLVRFQQAYQASSRVIQVAKETFQSILQIG